MRILVFNWRDITHPWAGGAELHLHEVAKRWVEWGHAVTIFCGQYPGAGRYDCIDGVHILRRGGRYGVYIWAVIYYFVRFRGKYDIVVDTENGIPFFTPLWCRLPKLCVMHHSHEIQFNMEFNSVLATIGIFLEKIVMPRLYRNVPFVAVSESTKEDLCGLGIGRENIDVIHNGLDHSLFCADGAKADCPTIVYVGRLKAYKRIELLLEIFARVLETVPNALMHIAGRGEMSKRLEAFAQDLGVAENVVFHGYVSEPEKVWLLQSAWLFITASITEGWGLTVLEANACGTPALAFHVPGLKDAIRNLQSGVLVTDTKQFVKYVVNILEGAAFRDYLSRNAVVWARRFDWERTAAEFLAILERLNEEQ